MSDPGVGRIGWVDLTVPDAAGIRDFYQRILGWQSTEIPVEDHVDFSMRPAAGTGDVAGICHALGPNAGIPPVWLVYFTVADLPAAVESALPEVAPSSSRRPTWRAKAPTRS